MSATNRGAIRSEGDFYETPSWCVESIAQHVPFRGTIIDAGCGTGGITIPLLSMDRVITICAVDSSADRLEILRSRTNDPRLTTHHDDFTTWDHGAHCDMVVMNPPFNQALDFVQHGLELSSMVVALLRLNWLSSQRRSAWLAEHTPDVYVLSRRPSFTGGKTDATDYAWMVWRGRSRFGVVQIIE